MYIKLYNSLSKKIESFSPLNDNEVRMYSCGPTVYNYAHIGNMRAFLFADLLQRAMRSLAGYKVKWVMNITNIDDKTIRDSRPGSPEWKPEMGKQTEDPLANLLNFTQFYEEKFFEDLSSLGVNMKHFSHLPKATEYVAHMQNLIRRIVERGLAYPADGSIYFNVAEWRKVDVYGKLKKIDFDNMKNNTRIDSDQYERDQVSDFVLWKAKKEGEPFWNFRLNGINYPGRPGWHIECSAMEFELLGLPFDVHTGGIDLQFPHHEDEIAQSKAGYGVEPTLFWCHNEFLEVEGEKMSKSKGNFYTVRDLINKGLDPLDIRYAILSAHYASIFNFTFDGIKAAGKARARLQEYIYEVFDDNKIGTVKADVDKLKREALGHLAEDLHTPKLLAEVFNFINNNDPKLMDEKSKEKLKTFFKDLNSIFEVWKLEAKVEEKIDIPDEIVNMAELRIQAKKDKQYATADLLRQKINDAGYEIKDTKDSYIITKA
jgi:cysteinyl-tRNA synthetase